MKIKLGVLASGRGSNFHAVLQAIQSGTLNAEVRALISDRKNAQALATARDHGIDAVHMPYDKDDREAFERQAADLLADKGCDLIVLAGFMRLVTPYFLGRFRDRVINIHPSLLPSFKGLHAQAQALKYGVKIAGCTVHVVTEHMDAGPILAQQSVPVLDDDTEETLSKRILAEEHKLLPEAIALYAKKLFSEG